MPHFSVRKRLLSVASLASAIALVACTNPVEEEAATPADAAAPVSVTVSDELVSMNAPANAIEFWVHPVVAFAGLMVTASADGVIAYSVEDGYDVSAVPGINARGLALSYVGFAKDAAGLIATFDETTSAFKFIGIDNATRELLPLLSDFTASATPRGFCLGRSISSASPTSEPTLFALSSSGVDVFNLSFAIGAKVSAEPGVVLETAEGAIDCTVDGDGRLLVLSQSGSLYRYNNASPTRIAQLDIVNGSISIVRPGIVAVLNGATGEVSLVEVETGKMIGTATFQGTDDIDGVSQASAFGISGANFGGVYRNGVIALSIAETGSEETPKGPTIRLAPFGGVANGLSIDVSEPVNLRGLAPLNTDELIVTAPAIDIALPDEEETFAPAPQRQEELETEAAGPPESEN